MLNLAALVLVLLGVGLLFTPRRGYGLPYPHAKLAPSAEAKAACSWPLWGPRRGASHDGVLKASHGPQGRFPGGPPATPAPPGRRGPGRRFPQAGAWPP
uniref:Uncharacterized protein n=1 Tax=Thermus tengchongensis TaxID=1214928 RepID=A0A7V4ANB4_9DEIN